MSLARSLFALVALLRAAPALGALATPATSSDPEWAVSMKFNSQPCTLSTASNAFVRNPVGCNPTPSGVPEEAGSSWTVECAGGEWSIVRYLDPMLRSSSTSFPADVLQSCLDQNMTDAENRTLQPGTTCQVNAKGQFEQDFCYQSLGASMDPWGDGRAHWSIGLALYNKMGCNDDDMFMYEFRSNGVCIDNGNTQSEMWNTDGTRTIMKIFSSSSNCNGASTAHPFDGTTPATLNPCIHPYANGIWMKIFRWDGLLTTGPTTTSAPSVAGARQGQGRSVAPIILAVIVAVAMRASVLAL